MKEKILCGVGENGVAIARAAGASKATCSRTGETRFFLHRVSHHRVEKKTSQNVGFNMDGEWKEAHDLFTAACKDDSQAESFKKAFDAFLNLSMKYHSA